MQSDILTLHPNLQHKSPLHADVIVETAGNAKPETDGGPTSAKSFESIQP